MRLLYAIGACAILAGCDTTDISKVPGGNADASTATAVTTGDSSTTVTNFFTFTETETELRTDTQTVFSTATTTNTVIVPTTVTATVINNVTATVVNNVTATVTKTATQNTTVTASSVQTVTATQTLANTVTATATQTVPVTVTATATATRTQTATVTNSSVQTVTATVTETATVTATSTSTSLNSGSFSSSVCFLNKPASDGFGRKVYSLATLTLERNGKGLDAYSLFDDERCEKSFHSWKSELKYKLKKSRQGVYVFEVEQYNDPDNSKDISRYWLVGCYDGRNWVFDVNYANGSPGPFLREPSEEELKEISVNIGKRGILFKRQ